MAGPGCQALLPGRRTRRQAQPRPSGGSRGRRSRARRRGAKWQGQGPAPRARGAAAGGRTLLELDVHLDGHHRVAARQDIPARVDVAAQDLHLSGTGQVKARSGNQGTGGVHVEGGVANHPGIGGGQGSGGGGIARTAAIAHHLNGGDVADGRLVEDTDVAPGLRVADDRHRQHHQGLAAAILGSRVPAAPGRLRRPVSLQPCRVSRQKQPATLS